MVHDKECVDILFRSWDMVGDWTEKLRASLEKEGLVYHLRKI